MSLPNKDQILRKMYQKKRDIALSNLAISELSFLEYPKHSTAICILSRVTNPDIVVAYTYGGTEPHIFSYDRYGNITEETEKQFTWEWMPAWLDQNVAIAIIDVPSYFGFVGLVPSLYRVTDDRKREIKQAVDVLSSRFPESKIVWHGLSYGAAEASVLSTEDTKLHKIAVSSAPWEFLEDHDTYHQGVRLNNYDVSTSKIPFLIAIHEKEIGNKATEQMQKTESVIVKNDVSLEDAHFFRGKQVEAITAMCNWFRDKPFAATIE